MKYNIISSSSKGNCYIYNQDLMIDIGTAFAKIKPYLRNIKLLCLTHQHQDHINKKTLKKLLYEKPTIKIICGEWLVQMLVDLGINKKNIFVLNLNKKYNLGKYIIELVLATHDVPNCGYKITIKNNNYKIFHITDTSNLDNIEAKGYNLYLIESNYNEELLKKHIEECEDENMLYYLNRVPYTHLSYEQANSFLIENMDDNSRFEYIHQSDYNFEEE
jgi:mRNA degradation ribonuclease J1/J2